MFNISTNELSEISKCCYKKINIFTYVVFVVVCFVDLLEVPKMIKQVLEYVREP